ncbi:MAG: 30S ribosomal protein S6 [Chloroflexi bacterium AL-W]|nr:30S ribosomal protein S6 [Chloroflexi bacterium AL-W]
MKRAYELTVVLRLENDDILRENIQQVKDWVEVGDLGTVTKIDTNHFGRRKLAYEIEGQREAYYVVFHADIDGTANEELERELGLAPFVLRHLLIRADE